MSQEQIQHGSVNWSDAEDTNEQSQDKKTLLTDIYI